MSSHPHKPWQHGHEKRHEKLCKLCAEKLVFFLQSIPEDSGHLGCWPQALVLVAALWILPHSLPEHEADLAVHPTTAGLGMPMTQGFSLL